MTALTRRSLYALLPLALTLGACGEGDDTDTDVDTDTSADSDTEGDTSGETSAIVGDWVSEGDNLAPLFQTATYNYTSIDATFEASGSYEVIAITGGGDTYTFTGTYTVDASTDPHGIVLEQTSPAAATSEGIFAITDGEMEYEVVVTTPDYGFTAPTPETGFGSTAGAGLSEGDNIQIFVAAE